MTTKVLDLDELETGTPEKVLKLKGKEHPLKPLSVRDFIDQSKEAKKLINETDASVHVEHLVKLVKGVFPTLTDEDLNDLSMEQLNKILDFARADNGGEETGSKKAKAKK
jgi:hypothetical protein